MIGRFQITRPLKLLDVEALRSIYVEGSIFDSTYIERLKKAKFLVSLSSQITKLGAESVKVHHIERVTFKTDEFSVRRQRSAKARKD